MQRRTHMLIRVAFAATAGILAVGTTGDDPAGDRTGRGFVEERTIPLKSAAATRPGGVARDRRPRSTRREPPP